MVIKFTPILSESKLCSPDIKGNDLAPVWVCQTHNL